MGLFDKLLGMGADSADDFVNRGDAYMNKQAYDKAVAEYTEAIRLDPQHAVAHRARGVAYDNLENYDRALADLTKAIQLDPLDAIAYGNRGIVFGDVGNLDKAVADYTEAIRLNPQMAAAYGLRRDVYRATGDLDKAVHDSIVAVRLETEYLGAHVELAEACSEQGELDQAIACYTTALEVVDATRGMWPDEAEASLYNDRGYARFRKGDFFGAITDYNKAIQLRPNDALSYVNRGNAYMDTEKYDRAVADYTNAIRCDPENAGMYFCRGNALVNTHRYADAVADYTTAIKIDPRDEQLWCNRGSARVWQAEYDQALADYSQALQLDPQDPIALEQRFVATCGAKLKKLGGPLGETGPKAEAGGQTRASPRAHEKKLPGRQPSPASVRRVAARSVVTGKEGEEKQCIPPSAGRVAQRALVLASVVYRSFLEGYAESADAKQFHRQLLHWMNAVRLGSEVEKAERDLLKTPVGHAEQQTVVNGAWRSEGLATLAWALGRYELPPYDRRADLLEAANGLGFLDENAAVELLHSAAVRPSSEIDGLVTHTTIVNWRLRQFTLGSAPMDFPGYLKEHVAYRADWLDGLRFIDDDLAIGEKCIADVADDELGAWISTAVERQIAAYWLQGDQEVYSEVDAATLLMGL